MTTNSTLSISHLTVKFGGLVALDFDDGLVHRHGFPFPFLPGADLDLGDRFADFGDLQFDGHGGWVPVRG